MKFLTGTDDSGSDEAAADGQPEAKPDSEPKGEEKGTGDRPSYEELETKYSDLKTKVGKQGAEMGALKERTEKAEEKSKHALSWFDSFEKNPEAAVRQTAEKLGLEFKESKPPDFSDVLGANADKLTPESLDKIVQAKVNAAMQQNNATFKNAADAFVEERLATKYPAYDEDKTLRRMVTDRIATGDIPLQEVAQVLVEWGRQEQTLAKTGADAVDEYKADLARKNKELLEGGAGGEDEPKKERSHRESAAMLPRA